MAIVYLGLGTNLGDKAANLHAAVHLISGKIGKVISLSSFYATAPWGFESENSFLNAAICLGSLACHASNRTHVRQNTKISGWHLP